MHQPLDAETVKAIEATERKLCLVAAFLIGAIVSCLATLYAVRAYTQDRFEKEAVARGHGEYLRIEGRRPEFFWKEAK